MSFRVGSTLLLSKDCFALQSYNFNTKRILGSVENALHFLDEYEVDEIHVIVPLKGKSNFISSEVFSKLINIPISTPVTIGGGIQLKDLKVLLKDPFFERIVFNSAIFDGDEVLKTVASLMGRQALIACMPFIIDNHKLLVYNSRLNKFISISQDLWSKINKIFNEIILLDANAEGTKRGFNFNALDLIQFPIDRTLISGGITNQDIFNAQKLGLAGVTIDNWVLHSESSVKGVYK